jgi:NADPH-dependent curcumin reductase CurA
MKLKSFIYFLINTFCTQLHRMEVAWPSLWLRKRASRLSGQLDAMRPTCSPPCGRGGVTALQILKSFGTKFDGTSHKCNILITAASGSVGHYLVQLARLSGHHMTATCGAHNIDLVKNLRANDVLDCKTPEGERLTSSSGKPYDYVINCVPSTYWSNALDANLASERR